MAKVTKYDEADKAIKAYDDYVFMAAGRAFDANRADTLAAIAALDCDAAAKDRTVNQTTRDIYKKLAVEFNAIAA